MIVRIALIGINEQEVQILETVLKQRTFDVTVFPPSTGSYLEVMKFKPDAILMEMPNREVEQLHLTNLIRGNKKMSKLPIISYGNHTERSREKQYSQARITRYYQRPLKISNIFNALIETVGPDIEKLINGDTEGEADERGKDILSIMKPDMLGSQKIELMVKHVGKLMAFPFSIAKIVQLTGSEKSSAGELANVIRSDASIATNIIKLSNSVFFSSRNREIKDVVDAIVRIGFNETKKIALGLTVMNLLDKKEKNFGFDRQEFWYHSLATALIAEKLSKAINYPNPSLAFLAGLLHEFATLLYDEFFGEIFEIVIEHTAQEHITFVDAGINIIKLDQNDFMAEMFAEWNMPKDLIIGLKGHTKFLNVNEGLPPEQSMLIKLVGLGDLLAKAARIGRSCDEVLHPVPDTLFQQLKLPIGIRRIFFDTIYSQIDLFVTLLNLDKTELPLHLFKKPASEEHLKMVILKKNTTIFEPHLFHLEHTGFDLITFSDPEDLVEKVKVVDLLVYNTTDEGGFEELDDLHSIVKDLNLPSLIFYPNPQNATIIPDLPQSAKVLTTVDATQIRDAIATVMGSNVEITPTKNSATPQIAPVAAPAAVAPPKQEVEPVAEPTPAAPSSPEPNPSAQE
ncbi:MAG: HDOD domain-containing protein [Fibrobacterales bacterium]